MENEIIEHCRQGQFEDFGKLYDIYAQNIYRFIYFKVQHKETVEDLTSTTFMKALEGIKSFNPEKASFKTWLYSIARNSVIDHFRVSKETYDIEDAFGVKSSDDIERDVDIKIKLEEVEKYLKKLTPEQREIIILRVWGGHGFKEIAEITGKTEASCKMMFKRVIERLRDDFGPIAVLFIIYFNFFEI